MLIAVGQWRICPLAALDRTMPKTWNELIALPQFQALTPQEREQVRNAYFDTVVAPQAGWDQYEAARAEFDAQTTPPKPNDSLLGDIPDLLQRGLYNAAGGVADFVGADTPAQWLYDQGKAQLETMTPETQQALQQPLFSEEGDYYLGAGATSPRAWLAQGLDTLGGMALPIPGGALARAALRPLLGLGKAALAAKAGLMAQEGMTAGRATRAAQRLAPDWRDTAANIAGYGGMEALVSGGLAEQQTREQVLAMPQEQLDRIPEYLDALQANDGDVKAARQWLAESLGKEAGWKTFFPTVALGAGAGHFYDKLIGGGGTGSRLKNMAQGAATEALEEAPQSLAEQVAQNTTLQSLDPNIGAFDQAIPNMLTGAALGGLGGGLMAGAMPKGTLERAAAAGEQAAGAGLGATPPPSPEELARQQQEQMRAQQQAAQQQQKAAQQQQQAQQQAQRQAQEAEKLRQAQIKTQQADLELNRKRAAAGLPPIVGGAPWDEAPPDLIAAQDDAWAQQLGQGAEEDAAGPPSAASVIRQALGGQTPTAAPVQAPGPVPGPVPVSAPSAVAVPAVEPVRGTPQGPRPDEDVWEDNPDHIDQMEREDGTWTLTRRPSRDGRWDLYEDITPDGEIANQEVWPRQATPVINPQTETQKDAGSMQDQGQGQAPDAAKPPAEVGAPSDRGPTDTFYPVRPSFNEALASGQIPAAHSEYAAAQQRLKRYADRGIEAGVYVHPYGGFVDLPVAVAEAHGLVKAQPSAPVVMPGDELATRAYVDAIKLPTETIAAEPPPKDAPARVWWDMLESGDKRKILPNQPISFHGYLDLPEETRQEVDKAFGQAMGSRIDTAAKQQKQLTPVGLSSLPALRERHRRLQAKIDERFYDNTDGWDETQTLEHQDPTQAKQVDKLFAKVTEQGLGDLQAAEMRGNIIAPAFGLKPSAALAESIKKRYIKALRQAYKDAPYNNMEEIKKRNNLWKEWRKLTGKDDQYNALLELERERDAISEQINDVLAEQYRIQQRVATEGKAPPRPTPPVTPIAEPAGTVAPAAPEPTTVPAEPAPTPTPAQPEVSPPPVDLKTTEQAVKALGWETRRPSKRADQAQKLTGNGFRRVRMENGQPVEDAQGPIWAKPPRGDWGAVGQTPTATTSIPEIPDNSKAQNQPDSWKNYVLKYVDGKLTVFDKNNKKVDNYEGFATQDIGGKLIVFNGENGIDSENVLLLSEPARDDEQLALQEARKIRQEYADLLERFTSSPDTSGVEYRVAGGNRGNSVTITPKTVGGVFTGKDIQNLRVWLKPYGFSVIKTTDNNGVLRIVAKDQKFGQAFANLGKTKPTLVTTKPSVSVPIEEGLHAENLRKMRSFGREAGKADEPRTLPEWVTEGSDLADAWQEGYSEGIADRVKATLAGTEPQAEPPTAEEPTHPVDEMPPVELTGMEQGKYRARVFDAVSSNPDVVSAVLDPNNGTDFIRDEYLPQRVREALVAPDTGDIRKDAALLDWFTRRYLWAPGGKPEMGLDVLMKQIQDQAEAKRQARAAAERNVHRRALESKYVQLAALSVARGDEVNRAVLRSDLIKAIMAAAGEELAHLANVERDSMTHQGAAMQAVDELLRQDESGALILNPQVFTEDTLAAWEADLLRQATRTVRQERKAAHQAVITEALSQAWKGSGFWQADPDEMVQGLERLYMAGWNHALEGGTGSNLPPEVRATDNRIKRMGYDAAVTWLGTEDGKAFATGAKARKMQGVGEALRRRQDERKQRLMAIDLSQDDQAEAFVNAVLNETERAELFPLPDTETATPGLRRYLSDLRDQIMPFKEWMASMGYGGRGKYSLAPTEAMRQLASRGQTKREEIRRRAEFYLEQVSGLAQVFANAKTVADATSALADWAYREGATRGALQDTPPHTTIISDEASPALETFAKGIIQPEDGTTLFGLLRGKGGFARASWSGRTVISQYLAPGPAARRFSRDENTPSENSRNQPLTRPRFDRVEREGEDYRQGRNVTAEELASTFGLRGVTYGEGVTAKQRQDHTNYAFDAFMDLAKLLGIEPRHIGLGGRVSFAFGALGRGRHAAHYTPDNNGQGQAINLTNTKGDGSVAHEWFHALDWNLRPDVNSGADQQVGAIRDMVALLSTEVMALSAIERELDRFLSGRVHWTRMGKGATPQDHARRYLERTLDDLNWIATRGRSSDPYAGSRTTAFKRDADELGKDYWGNPAELFARAGEAWVYDSLPGSNNYLVSDWVAPNRASRPTYRGRPYPAGDERVVFNDAFPRLLEQIEWTDEGPRLKGSRPQFKVLNAQNQMVARATTQEDAERRLALAKEDFGLKVPLTIREEWIPGVWEDSPLRAQARDTIERVRELMATLEDRDTARQAAASAAKQAEAQAQAAAAAQREAEEAERLRQEWEALQAQKPPTLVPETPGPHGEGALSLEDLSALFDEAAAELEEAQQEGQRGPETPPSSPTTTATGEPTPPPTGPAFVDDPNRGVLALAERLAQHDWTTPLSWRALGALADEAFGGTKAEGQYTPKDAYDALEMALNRVILRQGLTPNPVQRAVRATVMGTVAEAQEGLRGLDAFDNQIPTQTNRTAEQDEFQQFSTPHAHAALMARVANLDHQDVVLEPSAGSGNLVTMPRALGVEAIHVNELSPRRAAILEALGFSGVTMENGEQIANILGPRGLRPTVVIMNPPFSASAGRVTGKRDNRIGAQHVEEALKLLAPGGRAVILMGRGYTRGHARLNQHWAWLLKNFNVRANLGLDGSQYKKFGTSFDNRLVVIDKTGPTPNPDAILRGEGLTVAQALELLENIRNDRTHVGGRFGSEPGGGAVAEEGRLIGGEVASPAVATGAMGNGQPGDVGTLGAGTGGDGGAAAVPGTQRGQGARGGGRTAGANRRPRNRPATQPTGANAGGRGGTGAGADVLPGAQSDQGLADSGVAASLSQAAAEFAKHGVEGINETLAGLEELFGGNSLKSFPGGLDEETYAKARPHFQKAAQAFLAAGNDFKEFFKVLIRAFGVGIKPYAVRFAQEWQEGKIDLGKTMPAPEETTPANEPVEPEPEAADQPKALTDSIYEGYSPDARWAGLGAKPHPSALVESAAMAAVPMPPLTVELQFPRAVYTEGRLSAAQLDAVAYSEQAHQRILPSGERQGFFIGDGTGVGKGREIAGILYHNWLQGRRKAVWLSVNNDLYVDSQAYLKAVAGGELGLFNLQKVNAKSKIETAEGVAFVTYPMLRAEGKGVKDATGRVVEEGQKRLDQLVAWLGEDFEGVIAFDEAHNMGNALEIRGLRGRKKPSQVALLGVELQRRLPKARVVYVSATGATEPNNLGYLTRLGLWGAGTPFPNVGAFVGSVASSGLAAMEVVAKDMKALGVYLARSLPFHEVSYAQLEHALTADQRELYDTIAGAWQIVLRDVNAALGSTSQGQDGRAKANAMGAFWGAQQRFFNQMLTSLQMPSLIQSIEADLAAGRAPILQFVNTNEASQEREAARLAAEERELEELDITPRQVLMQFLENSFPVNQYEEYQDEDGNVRVRPVLDSQGNPVQNLEAVAARDSLLDRVAQMHFPDNPIDIVVGHFGTDKVAEITGRKRRFVRDPKSGKVTEEKRNDALREREVDEFQGDKRQILVFSDKGGTGKSYHADLNVRNQRKRVHYVVQPGWRADKAIQGLGRSHRTNQAQAPHVVLVTTDLRGHRRFVASIARRMDQLGALTKGHRKTGGQGLFTEEMNLESVWADRALEVLIGDIMAGGVEGMDRQVLKTAMGLEIEDRQGNRRASGQPSIQQFLNRILVLEAEQQNRLFDAFSERLLTQIEAARANGTLDQGLENITAKGVRKVQEQEVLTHPRTGAKTRLVQLELTNPIDHWTFDAFMETALAHNWTPFFARNRHSGRVWAFTPGPDLTDEHGRVAKHYLRRGTAAGRWTLVPRDEIGDPRHLGNWQTREAIKKWDYLDLAQAREAWAEQYAVAPKEEKQTVHLLSGVLLPIWDRLTDAGRVRVQRALTDDGEMVLGRHLANDKVDQILLRLTGTSRAGQMTPTELFNAVLNNRMTAVLANNWRLVPRLVAGDRRIELTGPSGFSEGDLLRQQGVIFERIGYGARYFIPTDPDLGPEVLTRVMENRPAVELLEEGAGTRQSVGQGAGPAQPMDLAAATTRLHTLLGAKVARVLLESGIIRLERRGRGAGYQGATYSDGTLVLNLDALDGSNFDGVLEHEGFHATVRELLGEETYRQVMGRLEKLLAGKAPWVAKARMAVPKGTAAANLTEEVGAYAIEQFVNGEPQPGLLRRWAEELLSALRAAIIRRLLAGRLKNWALANLQARDLAKLAIAGLRARARAAGMVPVLARAQYGQDLLYSLTQKQGRIRRSIDELVQAAQSQATWKNWYDEHQQTLTNLFGEDAALFQKILSATSQAASVQANVGLAMKAYQQLLADQPFTGYLPAVIKNLERIRQETALEGAKISQFHASNQGNAEAIAVDRHIAMLLFNTKIPNVAQIAAAKRRIQVVASRLNWAPRQAQSALWAYNQVRLGKDPGAIESYDKLLERKADLIRAIQAQFSRGGSGGLSTGGGVVAGDPEGGATADGGGEEDLSSLRFSQADEDTLYFAALERGDMETVERMVREAAERAGVPVLREENVTAYRVRRSPPPKQTQKAYKLFRVKRGKQGEVFALFVGANDPLPQGVWLDAIPGPEAAPTKTGRPQVKSKLGGLSYRPGWHAGDLPLATHIGAKDSPTGPVVGRKDDEVWAEVEMAADVDYQLEADANGTRPDGTFVVGDADIKRMPENGLYRYKTNPNMTGKWIISGAMKINRVLSEQAVNDVLRESGAQTMPWMSKPKGAMNWQEGPLDLARWGLDTNPAVNQKKLLDPVTYDDNGQVIPLSQRFDRTNPDIRYSVADGADAGGSPLGGGRAFLESVKQTWADQWTQQLPRTLGALSLRQLAEVGSAWVPGLKTYDSLRTRMETRRNVMMEEAGKLGDAVDSWARAHRVEARAAFELMNDATAAQVDPADFQPVMVPLQLGPGPEMLRNWAATDANVQELRRRVRVWKRSADHRERALAAYYAKAARVLMRAARAEKRRQAASAELIARWEALSDGRQHLGTDGRPFATEQAAREALRAWKWPKGTVAIVEEVPGGWAIQELGGKQVYTRFRDLYKQRSREMMEALIKRIETLSSLTDEDKRALAARIRHEFESPVDEMGNPRIGPYFPFQRFGRWYLFARKAPEGGGRSWLRQDGTPFASPEAAWAALHKRRDLDGVNARPVKLEDGSGWELREVGEEGFWLFESVAERREAAARMKEEGWEVRGQGLTKEAHRELEGVSEGFVAEAIDKLKRQGSKDEADTLYQLYLQTLQQMSIRKHFMHRKGTKGYTSDQLRAFGWNMTRLAHQVSKLEAMPRMEQTLRDMEDEIQAGRADKEDGDVSKENALLEEVKKRHEWIAHPDNAPWTNAVSALGFMFYLGVSPAAALVNLTQVPIVALPALAARLRIWAGQGGQAAMAERGEAATWGEAGRALTAAFVDVARGFNPGVIKAFLTGRPMPSEAANLTAEERAAFGAWDQSGARDRTQAHNLAGIGDADSWLNGPTFNRVMGAISSLFHAAEVVNRDATLLAAYRLARSKGLDHATAVAQAEEVTWEAHFDYCVPMDTECLTTAGWKLPHEIKVGDTAIAVDADGLAVESPITEVNLFPGKRKVTEFSHATSRMSFAATDGHEHLVRAHSSRQKAYGPIRKVTTKDLNPSTFMLRAPLGSALGRDERYGKDFAALLGWIAAEGWYSKFRNCKRKSDVRLEQSLHHNLEHVEQIRGLLLRLGGEYKEYPSKQGRHILWVLNGELRKRVLQTMPNKLLTFEMFATMTLEEMRAVIAAFGDGDGHRQHKTLIIGQHDMNKQNLHVLQAMATACGIRATIGDTDLHQRVTLIMNDSEHRGGRHSQVRQMQRREMIVDGVWCPTTTQGTWVARRHGAIVVTGNSNANRPRFMQKDVAKALLMFKNYAQHVFFFLGRNLFLWAKGQSPEVRREARTKFAGMVGMTALFAGVSGLPLGAVFALANVIQALFGDDDQPWDAETEWRRLLERTFPRTVADIIDRGAVNKLSGLDFASRVSLSDLIWRSPNRDLDGAGLYQHIVEQVLGPVGGILARPFTMYDHMREGEWVRAAESATPKFMKDLIQAGRFGAEGVMSRKGDEILPRENLSSWELLWKAMGLAPDEVQDRYERNAAVKLYERRIIERRRLLLTAAALARIAKDREALAAAREKIAQFNRANPGYKISGTSIRRSVHSREAMRERARTGIVVNPKLAYLYEQAGGYEGEAAGE